MTSRVSLTHEYPSIQERFIDLGIYKREDIETAINRKSVGGSAATEVTDGSKLHFYRRRKHAY
jgi:hypothetical protein